MSTFETTLLGGHTFEVPIVTSAPGTVRYTVNASSPVDSYFVDALNRQFYLEGRGLVITASVRGQLLHSAQAPVQNTGAWYLLIRNTGAEPARVQGDISFDPLRGPTGPGPTGLGPWFDFTSSSSGGRSR